MDCEGRHRIAILIAVQKQKNLFIVEMPTNPNGLIDILVRETGLEPVRVAPHAPQTCASADSATLASNDEIITKEFRKVNTNFKKISKYLQVFLQSVPVYILKDFHVGEIPR